MPTKKAASLKTKQPVIFWGASGQAKMLHECLLDTEFELVALFDSNKNTKSPFSGVPIFHDASLFFEWRQEIYPTESIACLVAIGGANGEERLQIQENLQLNGFKPIIIKHPTAHIAHNSIIGDGSQILPQACINVDVRIGRAVIINSGAIIEHECIIGNGVHIAPRACLAGLVKVEDFATIFSGATVIPRVTIGTGAIIGAGTVVIHDVPPHSVVVGTPARIIKTNKHIDLENSYEVCEM